MNLAEKINKNTLRLADGITKLPFDVPQFYKDGGEVDLFKNYPNNQGLAQRLPQASSNAATQSQDLRFQMDKQGKSYMPKPDPYRVNLGQNAGFTPPTNIKPVGPTLVDSNMAAGIANNAANLYQGPYKDQVMSMFPKPQYKEGGEVDPTESGGYGLIQGEGTGKSDDIDATLNQQDYILPIETVDMVGRQWLDDLVARIMGDEQAEGEGQTPQVEAKVSNQEYRIPAEVVEELGVEFFDKLKQLSGVPDLSKTVDGKPAYAYGDYVDDEALKNILKNNVDSYPADPNRFGYQGVPSTKQIQPYVERGTNLVPQSIAPKVDEYKPNFTTEGGPYRNVNNYNYAPVDSGKQLSTRAIGPEIDPYTGRPITRAPFSFGDIGNSIKNFAKGVVTDPVFLGTAAYNANENLLNNSIRKGNNLESGSRLAFSLSGNPSKLLNDPLNEKGTSPLGKVVEYFTPVPELVTAGRFNKKSDTNKTLKQLDQNKIDDTQKQNSVKNILGQPVQTPDNFFGGYKVYGNNGAQAIEVPWNQHDESAQRRFLPAEEYTARQQRAADYQDQRNAAVIPYSEENQDTKYGSSQTFNIGGFNPNTPSLDRRSYAQNQVSNRYDVNDLGIYNAIEGPAADAAYQQQQQQLKDYNAARKAMADPDANEQTRKFAQSIIDKYKEKFGVQ